MIVCILFAINIKKMSSLKSRNNKNNYASDVKYTPKYNKLLHR